MDKKDMKKIDSFKIKIALKGNSTNVNVNIDLPTNPHYFLTCGGVNIKSHRLINKNFLKIFSVGYEGIYLSQVAIRNFIQEQLSYTDNLDEVIKSLQNIIKQDLNYIENNINIIDYEKEISF